MEGPACRRSCLCSRGATRHWTDDAARRATSGRAWSCARDKLAMWLVCSLCRGLHQGDAVHNDVWQLASIALALGRQPRVAPQQGAGVVLALTMASEPDLARVGQPGLAHLRMESDFMFLSMALTRGPCRCCGHEVWRARWQVGRDNSAMPYKGGQSRAGERRLYCCQQKLAEQAQYVPAAGHACIR